MLTDLTRCNSDVFLYYGHQPLVFEKKIVVCPSLAGMALASTRGMMCVAALGFTQVVDNFLQHKKEGTGFAANFKILTKLLSGLLPAYLPVIFITVSFLVYHYIKTGWIGYHTSMPWYPLFRKVNFSGAVYNIGILGWRLIDFGRLFVWIAALYCLVHYVKYRPKVNSTFLSLIILSVSVLLIFSYIVVFHKNLSGHRYLLPAYFSFALAMYYYLFHFAGFKWKKAFFVVMLAGLLSGNFWIYPDSIAKGWDSTLAYLPYHPLRKQMLKYMQQKGIKMSETGTTFPNHGKLKYFDVSDNEDSFDTINMKTNRYIFYSNVFNDVSDEELKELSDSWKKVKEFRCVQVRVTLYEKP